MSTIDKAMTPDGMEIELVDLSGDSRLPDFNGFLIKYCTVAKQTFPEELGWYAKEGKEFRSCIYTHRGYTSDMLKEDYESLKNGSKTLADLKEHFWNRKRDCFVLGL